MLCCWAVLALAGPAGNLKNALLRRSGVAVSGVKSQCYVADCVSLQQTDTGVSDLCRHTFLQRCV